VLRQARARWAYLALCTSTYIACPVSLPISSFSVPLSASWLAPLPASPVSLPCQPSCQPSCQPPLSAPLSASPVSVFVIASPRTKRRRLTRMQSSAHDADRLRLPVFYLLAARREMTSCFLAGRTLAPSSGTILRWAKMAGAATSTSTFVLWSTL
jgi:hypothetical protein